MWKYILAALIKLLGHLLGTHYSYFVTSISSAREEKNTLCDNWHFDSVHKLYETIKPNQPATWGSYSQQLMAS